MTIFAHRMSRLRLFATLAVLLCANAYGDIIHESASAEGGTSFLQFQASEQAMVGARFSLPTGGQITAVGGDLASTGGSLFAAIVPLADANALPAGPIESIAIGHVLFEAPVTREDDMAPLNLILGPGDYALVIGAHAFGATATFGSIAANHPTLPGSSLLQSVVGTWIASAFTGMRLVVAGDVTGAADGAIVHESAAATGGNLAVQFNASEQGSVGARFSLPYGAQITAVGGDFAGAGGTLFAAIVPLAAPDALPSGPVESLALAHTTLNAPGGANDNMAPLNVFLVAGDYALVIGAHAFGATATFGHITANHPVLPGASLISGSSAGWFESPFTGMRLLVEGVQSTDTDSDGVWDVEEVAAGSDRLNPDTDDDGIIDGLDRSPLSSANNLCLGMGANATLSATVVGRFSCAASASIAVDPAAAVWGVGGDLLLIAPSVTVRNMGLFQVQSGGALQVINEDPTALVQ